MAEDRNRDKMSGQGQGKQRQGQQGQGQRNLDPDRVKEQGRAGGGSRPGVLGDETEEQNLNQPGNPEARITEQEIDEAFGQKGGSQGGKNPTR